MSMKKAIAAALIIGTMVMTGTAFAGPHFHGGQYGRGGFGGQRWEQRGHTTRYLAGTSKAGTTEGAHSTTTGTSYRSSATDMDAT